MPQKAMPNLSGFDMKYRIRAFLLALAVNALFLWALDHSLRNPPF